MSAHDSRCLCRVCCHDRLTTIRQRRDDAERYHAAEDAARARRLDEGHRVLRARLREICARIAARSVPVRVCDVYRELDMTIIGLTRGAVEHAIRAAGLHVTDGVIDHDDALAAFIADAP